jgi:hypothetical protein
MAPRPVQFLNAIECREVAYSAGTVRERHFHDATWVVFPLTGSFALNMRSQEIMLAPRSLLYVPAGETHANVFGAQGARIFVASIDPAWDQTVSRSLRHRGDLRRGALPRLPQVIKFYEEWALGNAGLFTDRRRNWV